MPTTVKDMMKKNPTIIPAHTTLQAAAQKMQTVDCGVLPVGTWDRLEGIITDRDIAVRAVAEGADVAKAQVHEYMTKEIFDCKENDTLEQAAEHMHENNVSRLVVRDESGKACGIITFGCILRKHESLKEIGKVVECAVGKKAA